MEKIDVLTLSCYTILDNITREHIYET